MLLPCMLRINSGIICSNHSKIDTESSKSFFLSTSHVFASPALFINFICWNQGWHHFETPHCEQRTPLFSCPVSDHCIWQAQGFEAQEGKAWEQILRCLSHTKELEDFYLLSTKLIHLRFHILDRDCALLQILETSCLHPWEQWMMSCISTPTAS